MNTKHSSGGASRPPVEDAAWAVWVGECGGDNRCVAVTADTEDAAREKALDEADDYDEVYHVDGPYQNGEPAVYEFTYYTEHKERVVVEAPSEDYAKETADAERDYRGDYVETIHTETRRVDKEREER